MKKRSKKHVYVQRTRINEEIRAPQVRTINGDGEMAGILPIEEALKLAQEQDLDLVEVAPDADPPVELRSDEQGRHRAWTRSELEPELRAAGFDVADTFGGMSEKPFVPMESSDLVIVAKRSR